MTDHITEIAEHERSTRRWILPFAIRRDRCIHRPDWHARTCELGASHARFLIRASRSQGLAIRSRSPRRPTMTVRRHVHHVHTGWPSPYVGFVAAVLFGV